MNLPEFYADPVSQMQVQAYGSSTREVHMFSTKCKHSEINASAIWRSISAKIQCSILHCTLHNLSYTLCLAFEFVLAIQLLCIQHSTLIYATFKFSLSTFNFSKATVRFWNSTFKSSGMYIHFLSSNI